ACALGGLVPLSRRMPPLSYAIVFGTVALFILGALHYYYSVLVLLFFPFEHMGKRVLQRWVMVCLFFISTIAYLAWEQMRFTDDSRAAFSFVNHAVISTALAVFFAGLIVVLLCVEPGSKVPIIDASGENPCPV